ncbi:GNAT family N-acetyltransferase [Humibacter sp. RRB41]|uniref:GNAT family N-acetyltransferase n=1 Tax=Humibacter sp. RRB41 TaxID=2919946 RepID=UPI001FAA17D7|nr:GNAT family N-acetyltransferase [Humibacter sp. RRB41]
MLTFASARTDDPIAADLLTRYFTEREDTFPSAQGSYRVKLPDPSQFIGDRGDFVIVSLDAAAAGCGGIRRIEDAADASGRPIVRFEVKHLWLDPASRGHGTGRALLNELEGRAAALGARQLVLDTNESLTAAGGLYRSSGYRTVEPYNDNPNATHWYAKDVTAS